MSTVTLRAGAAPEPLRVGNQFPALKGQFLTGRDAVLPKASSGRVALIAIGFTYKSRFPVETWAEWYRTTINPERNVTLFEVPMIGGLGALGRWFIDRGMRKGTPVELHDHVITVYGGSTGGALAHEASSSFGRSVDNAAGRERVLWRTIPESSGPRSAWTFERYSSGGMAWGDRRDRYERGFRTRVVPGRTAEIQRGLVDVKAMARRGRTGVRRFGHSESPVQEISSDRQKSHRLAIRRDGGPHHAWREGPIWRPSSRLT